MECWNRFHNNGYVQDPLTSFYYYPLAYEKNYTPDIIYNRNVAWLARYVWSANRLYRKI